MVETNVIIVMYIFRFKQCTFTASIVGSRQYCINSHILNVLINLIGIYTQNNNKLLGNNSQFGVQ